MLWAIAVLIAAMDLVLGGLALANWRTPAMSVQILHLLTALVGFAVLMWGFWGAVGAGAGAALTVLAVTVVAGHYSLRANVLLHRSPYLLELLLVAGCAWLCLQYLEREITEETGDRRQLEELEADYLDLAIQFGKKEDLLKVLERKEDRLRMLEGMGERVLALRTQPEQAIQYALDLVAQILGKGEAEVILFSDTGVTRHARGASPAAAAGGRDEIDHWMAEHRTALLVNNLTHDVRFTGSFGRVRKTVSLVAVPLYREGGLAGSFRVESGSPEAFTHDDLRFVSEAAGLLLPAIFA